MGGPVPGVETKLTSLAPSAPGLDRCLEVAAEPSVRQALIAAWRNTAPKRLAQQLDDE